MDEVVPTADTSMDNVFVFPGAKRAQIVQLEVPKTPEVIEQERSEDIEAQLKLLDQIKTLVATGRLSGLVILGRDPTTGYFLSDIHFPGGHIAPMHAATYIGQLEMLKMDFIDVGSMTPVLMADGQLLDPYEDLEEEDAQ